jgi:hypothetical protein
MKIQLTCEESGKTHNLILINRTNEIIICSEDGDEIAKIGVDTQVYDLGGKVEYFSKSFGLSFEGSKINGGRSGYSVYFNKEEEDFITKEIAKKG